MSDTDAARALLLARLAAAAGEVRAALVLAVERPGDFRISVPWSLESILKALDSVRALVPAPEGVTADGAEAPF